jgi:hypothetical protein
LARSAARLGKRRRMQRSGALAAATMAAKAGMSEGVARRLRVVGVSVVHRCEVSRLRGRESGVCDRACSFRGA